MDSNQEADALTNNSKQGKANAMQEARRHGLSDHGEGPKARPSITLGLSFLFYTKGMALP